MPLVSTKLRQSARGQACTFCIPAICNGNPETTVLAHIRDESKGLSNKANDYSAAFACSACHEHFDQNRMSKEERATYALRGLQRTHAIWVELGLMQFPETAAKPKPLSKTMPRRHPITGQAIG
jgi:hypothetical protein